MAIWGRTARGFARRPVDNVGLQYGLEALEAGQISVEQFVDLNEKVGGVDTDFAFTAERSEADPGSMPIAYWAGQVSNPYSLANLPIIDLRGSSNINDIHTDYHSWAMRARLDQANGGHGNQLIWTWPSGIVPPAAINLKAFLLMDHWLTAIENDHSKRPERIKVLRNKPSDAVDLCWSSTRPAGGDHRPGRVRRAVAVLRRRAARGGDAALTRHPQVPTEAAPPRRTTRSRSRTSSGRGSRARSRRASATGASRAWGSGSSASHGRG